jgi:hypothetical protein
MRCSFTVRARVMHTPERTRLTVLDDVIITVDDGGTIATTNSVLTSCCFRA